MEICKFENFFYQTFSFHHLKNSLLVGSNIRHSKYKFPIRILEISDFDAKKCNFEQEFT